MRLWLHLLRHRDPLTLLRQVAQDHPRLAYLRLGRERVYLLHHPDLITSLLVHHGRATRKGRLQEKIRIVLGDGLLTSEGEWHTRQRRLIQPALRPDQVDAYLPLMVEAAEEVSARWRDGVRVDLAREMSALTLTVVGRSLFGRGLEQATAELAACTDVLLSGSARHLVPGTDRLLALPTPKNRRLLRAADRLDALARQIVEEQAERPDQHTLLSVLVGHMDPEQARDEALTLLLAGHETTATALTWAWWLLDQHPEVAHWWYEEIDRQHGRPELDRLPRTRGVLAEAMRLYPPSWLVARRPTRPIELDGWTIPAGALCATSQWAMHRDARFWRAPREFRPDRWLAGGEFDEAAPGQPRGAYFPFGLGARSCVGRGFAWAEGTLLLATLGRRWAPRPAPEHQLTPLPAVTLRPRGGLPATLRARP